MDKFFRVLAIGDSLIKAKIDNLNGWAKCIAERIADYYNRPLRYYNKGDGGNTTRNILERFQDCAKLENYWDMLIVGMGVNDSRMRGTPPEYHEVPINEFVCNLKELFSNINDQKERFKTVIVPGICLVIEDLLLPYKKGKYYYRADSEKYNNEIEKCVKDYMDFIFIDFASLFINMDMTKHLELMPDGLHPDSKGHKFLCEFAWSILKNRLNSDLPNKANAADAIKPRG